MVGVEVLYVVDALDRPLAALDLYQGVAVALGEASVRGVAVRAERGRGRHVTAEDGLDRRCGALAQLGDLGDGLALTVDGARQADQLVRQPAPVVAPAALPGLAATAVALKSLLVALVRYGQESLVRLGDARKLRALLRLAYRVQHLVPPDERRRMSDAATLRRLVERQALRHARHELLPNGQALPGTLEYRVLRDGERLAAVLADELLRTVLAPPVALNVHPAAYRAHASTRKTTLRQERFHVLRASFGLN